MYDIRIVSGVQHCNEDKVPDSVQSTAEKIAQSMMRLLHITDAHFSLILCNLILDKLSWIIYGLMHIMTFIFTVIIIMTMKFHTLRTVAIHL